VEYDILESLGSVIAQALKGLSLWTHFICCPVQFMGRIYMGDIYKTHAYSKEITGLIYNQAYPSPLTNKLELTTTCKIWLGRQATAKQQALLFFCTERKEHKKLLKNDWGIQQGFPLGQRKTEKPST
ncbi:hypothetical protein ACJX0J_012111, partial [Zea mays]